MSSCTYTQIVPSKERRQARATRFPEHSRPGGFSATTFSEHSRPDGFMWRNLYSAIPLRRDDLLIVNLLITLLFGHLSVSYSIQV